ncbi:hypothetical protein PASLES2_12410 [Pseudomonas aeruginosa]
MSHDPPSKDRRHFLTTSSVLGAAGVLWSALPFANAASLSPASNPGGSMTADLILHNGRFHTVDRDNPTATAVAIKDGKFLAVGNDAEAMLHRGSATQVIDLQKRTVIPGLNDSHLHLIRGGLNYNLELRWEGVPSLADALRMLKNQAERTPSPQWVAGGRRLERVPVRREAHADPGGIEQGRAGHPGVRPPPVRSRPAQPRRPARGRLHQGHAQPARRRDRPRQQRRTHRHADRPAQRDDSLRHPGQGTEAAAGVPGQLHPPVHARTQPPRPD